MHFTARFRAARSGLAVAVLSTLCACSQTAPPATEVVARGNYLVTVGGCHDCHTPKIFSSVGPELDKTRLLSGHPAAEALPDVPGGALAPGAWGALTNPHLTAWAGPWGVSYAANLTPDKTGLADWTVENFIQAMRTGKHAGVGRPILPPMPWFNYAKMTDDDLRAMFAYLRSLPPIANAVPPPVLAPAAPAPQQ
jgi:mono/diheme cytochrome c family protein